MKKISILFLLTLLSTLTASAFDAEIDGIYYELSGTEATLRNAANYTGSVTIPATVTYDGVTYSVTKIGDNAFSYCFGLTSVTIPNSVTTIGSSAFSYCSGLTSVTIPNSVTLIGGGAFSGTAWYDNQPDGLVYAGKVAYGYKGTMPENTSISLEEGTLSIAEYAFAYCTGLTSVTIPSSVTSIGRGAFEGTTWFNNQPDGLVYAGKVAYGYKGTMPENTSISIVEGTLGVAQEAFAYCAGLTSVTIPNSVTEIGWSAFSGCSGLTSVTIGNSVTSIGYYAFSYCRGLTSVTIPNSVTSIGEAAFACSTGLTSVTIPSNVKKIGINAFRECSGLTSVTVPNSVTEIGNYAFSGCSGLTDVCCYAEDVPTTSNNAFNVSPISTATLHVPAASISAYKATEPWSGFGTIKAIVDENVISGSCGENLNFSLNLETGVLSITGTGAMDNYNSNNSAPWYSKRSYIKTVNIADGVTSIGSYAFLSSKNLTSVSIPNSMTSIGDWAFKNSSLTSVTIPNGVTEIGDEAFYACEGLTSVTIPNSVISIGESAFRDCFGLIEVSIPNSITEIKDYAFYYCRNLTEITIPNSVTSIGGNAFGRCEGLTEVTIPKGVTSIGIRAFTQCYNLTSVTLPSSVTELGDFIFYLCSKINEVYCYAEKVPNTSSSVFSNVRTSAATLHVPAASVEAYKATEPWSGFGSIVGMVEKCATPTISFVDGNVKFECETEGVEYVAKVTCLTSGEGDYETSSIPLTTTYKVTVYATKDGYENSEVATKDIEVGGGGSAGIRGDVNLDNEVGMPDVMFIVNYILNGTFPDEE